MVDRQKTAVKTGRAALPPLFYYFAHAERLFLEIRR